MNTRSRARRTKANAARAAGIALGILLAASFSTSVAAQEGPPGGALVEEVRKQYSALASTLDEQHESVVCSRVTGTYGDRPPGVTIPLPLGLDWLSCASPWCDPGTSGGTVVGLFCFEKPSPSEDGRFCEVYTPWLPEKVEVPGQGVIAPLSLQCINLLGTTSLINGECRPTDPVRITCQKDDSATTCVVWLGLVGCFSFAPPQCTEDVQVLCWRSPDPPEFCYVWVRSLQLCVR